MRCGTMSIKPTKYRRIQDVSARVLRLIPDRGIANAPRLVRTLESSGKDRDPFLKGSRGAIVFTGHGNVGFSVGLV